MKKRLTACCLVAGLSCATTLAQTRATLPCPAEDGTRRTEHLLIVTLDGLRWQEVFAGADSLLLAQTPELAPDFWASPAAERRQKLMPFLWEIIAAEGQVHGNRARGSCVNVANRRWFSYPGYNELLTGAPDDERIATNLPIRNPNKNVLEFIQAQPGFEGRVAAFASWPVFRGILPEKRGGFVVNAGFQPAKTAGFEALDRSAETVQRPWGEHLRPDALTFAYARQWLALRRPRVLFLGLGETDEFAHEGQYGNYLRAIQQADLFIAQLWRFAQNDPEYRDRTTLIVTTDHGRGRTAKDWGRHSARVPGSDEIWFAVIGPDTPAAGEAHSEHEPFFQQQMAQTFAALLGLDFRCEQPMAAERLSTVFSLPPALAAKENALPAAPLGPSKK